MATEKLKTASVLAFERKLDPSDGTLHAGNWEQRGQVENWVPVPLRVKSVRGTISNRLKTKDQDPAKLDAAIQNPNLQTVDVAMLPTNADTVRLSFTLRILGGAGRPNACNDSAYQQALEATVKGYVDEHGFGDLAQRYASNLANARFLWRNRLSAETIEVHIRHLSEGAEAQTWVFDALTFSLRNFDVPQQYVKEMASLADVIRDGLGGDKPVFLEVTTYARMGAGQEVYPSQELILDQNSNQKGRKSKTLYDVDGVAALHSQKIGNALRTVDTWYPEADEHNLGPIAVEPYGSVTSRGTAYRQPKQKMDFYNLLDGWVLKGQKPAAEQQHFVMATLIRGGVFGESQD